MKNQKLNTILIGDTIPNFYAESTTSGPLMMHEYKNGYWCLLCTHPADFTPVCDGELCTMQNWEQKFYEKKTVLLAMSVDTLNRHKEWQKQFMELDGISFSFPIIADPDAKICKQLGIVRDEAKTARTCFIVDPQNIVRATFSYPAEVGRNFKEILRLLTALQLSDSRPIACPVNWEEGAKVLIHPKLAKENYEKEFGKDIETVKPYLHKVYPDA